MRPSNKRGNISHEDEIHSLTRRVLMNLLLLELLQKENEQKAFEDWIRGMWRVGFGGFNLRGEAGLLWATVRNRQHEPGF